MLKRMQCIHGICVFQVQLSVVPTNVIASIREVWEPPDQIQEANVLYPSLNKRTGTYRPEYYMTIHRHTQVTQCCMPGNLQHISMMFLMKAPMFQYHGHNNLKYSNNRNDLQ